LQSCDAAEASSASSQSTMKASVIEVDQGSATASQSACRGMFSRPNK